MHGMVLCKTSEKYTVFVLLYIDDNSKQCNTVPCGLRVPIYTVILVNHCLIAKVYVFLVEQRNAHGISH